jgi:Raf kinase inhibitor-like YbhB/YbcL family protein
MVLSISSPAFNEGDKIPPEYTCDGQDISPQIDWGVIPKEARSLVLIVDDPDAPSGAFTHWVIFNIPPGRSQLLRGLPLTPELSDGSIQGSNDFGRIGYAGPCPPPGMPHRYHFNLYALDKQIDLNAGCSKYQVLDAIKGHILSQGKFSGTYQR